MAKSRKIPGRIVEPRRQETTLKYCFTIYCGSRLEIFSYNGDDDKFTPTSLNSVNVEGLKSVVLFAQGLRLICLVGKDLYVHTHDFDTIVDTTMLSTVGNVVKVDTSCSPGKKYLVLLCHSEDDIHCNDRTRQPPSTEVKIIEIKSGVVKGNLSRLGRHNTTIGWEESTNDQYFTLTNLGHGTLSLYGTDNFEQIGDPLKRPFKSFAWSPTGSKLILFQYPVPGEDGPGLVKLLEIPSRDIVFEMPLSGVINFVSFHWQSKGQHVAILYTACSQLNWIVYSVKTNTISRGSFTEKCSFVDFKWEPNRSKFACSYMAHDKSCGIIEFYKMKSVEGNPSWLNSSTLKSFISKIMLFWSPSGRYIVLKSNQKLRFVDNDSRKILAIVNYASSFVAWDPSGRFVQTTCDCEGEIKTLIWSFRGEPVYEFSAGKTMNWGGAFPVAENNDIEGSDDVCKRIPELTI